MAENGVSNNENLNEAAARRRKPRRKHRKAMSAKIVSINNES
jgi:hypothetical protein